MYKQVEMSEEGDLKDNLRAVVFYKQSIDHCEIYPHQILMCSELKTLEWDILHPDYLNQ